ncbi:Hsp70 family protein [Halalkalibacterium halodurans]|uniref:Hsp70 family protein n=1 Tax=Halalkalibacterium halodurans TaxID=86665 RepID=UPI0010677FF0|nr:Hsp70 family protein [Halalkalibacterium halodurans]MED3648602.1 Hsp70 family protein [Halalkalibacterium halodurans]TES48951.1 heat-shock protein Hsp70 [Halalkalibacterium halodurans]
MTPTKNSAENSFRPIVGIDLGTTNSAAAYIHKQKPKMLTLKNGERLMPSVVLLNQNGQIIAGEEARNALVAMPERTKAAVKRSMGEKITFSMGDQAYTPEELSAFILKEIKRSVDKELGEGDKEAVITVPAYFTNAQRQAVKKAGELAGFVVERIINEPTAAALAYGLQQGDEDKHILVYDLGGGTFDVSIVELMGGIMEVKASAGNNQLGGEDFDWLLVDWLADKVVAEHGTDPREDIRGKARLKEEAEKIKKDLSFQSSVDVSVPVITVKNNAPVGLDCTIQREEFVSLITPLLDETKEKLSHVLEDAGLAPGDVDEILLVGGSTKIPQVQQLITSFFNKQPKTDINPDEAVALGAAVQAGIKSGAFSDNGLIVTDVAPFSMGIAVLSAQPGNVGKPGAFHAIIPRNTTIPVTRTERYTTTSHNQPGVEIEIYQGENKWVKDNYFLNEFLLEGLPLKPAGEEAVDVTFRYNLNGILEVSAKSVSTGAEMSVTIEDALDRSSEEAFYDSLAKVEAAFQPEEHEDASDEELNLFTPLENDNQEEGRERPDSLQDLIKEADEWKRRFTKELENRDGETEKQINAVINRLAAAAEEKNTEVLNEAIESAIDLAVDLEL